MKKIRLDQNERVNDILNSISLLAAPLIVVSYWLTKFSPNLLWLASRPGSATAALGSGAELQPRKSRLLWASKAKFLNSGQDGMATPGRDKREPALQLGVKHSYIPMQISPNVQPEIFL